MERAQFSSLLPVMAPNSVITAILMGTPTAFTVSPLVPLTVKATTRRTPNHALLNLLSHTVAAQAMRFIPPTLVPISATTDTVVPPQPVRLLQEVWRLRSAHVLS